MCHELEGCFVVEHEAMTRARDKKKKRKEEKGKEEKTNEGTKGRALRRGSSFRSERGSEGILTLEYVSKDKCTMEVEINEMLRDIMCKVFVKIRH